MVIHPMKIVLHLDRSDTHIHDIYAKICKFDNDSATYLWHCRLGHIGVKSMKKLHTDGLLESLGTCEPCLIGKMTKTPLFRVSDEITDMTRSLKMVET